MKDCDKFIADLNELITVHDEQSAENALGSLRILLKRCTAIAGKDFEGKMESPYFSLRKIRSGLLHIFSTSIVAIVGLCCQVGLKNAFEPENFRPMVQLGVFSGIVPLCEGLARCYRGFWYGRSLDCNIVKSSWAYDHLVLAINKIHERYPRLAQKEQGFDSELLRFAGLEHPSAFGQTSNKGCGPVRGLNRNFSCPLLVASK